MDVERWWPRFVDVVAVIWVGLFAVDLAAHFGMVHLSPGRETAVRVGLQLLLFVFVLDVVLLYRWSEQRPRAFVRSNWLWILTVIPWFRPFRVLRVGRGVRALRILVRSRRAGSFLNKARRMGTRLWRRLNG